MLLPSFEFHEPADLKAALALMDRLGDQARPLAGGTDLLVNLKRGVVKAGHVVHLGRLADLKGVDGDGVLRLGALTTAADLARMDLGGLAALAEAAAGLGTPLVRNRATLGGNLINARPAADLAVALLALGGQAELESLSGRRVVDLDCFFHGPGQCAITAQEILTGVVAPIPEGAGSAFLKLGVRQSLEIALVNVAAFLRLGRDGVIKEARLSLGAVAPTPILSAAAARLLVGERPVGPGDPIFAGAALSATLDAKPIDDHRASARYRRLMIEVLSRRALGRAWLRAKEVRG